MSDRRELAGIIHKEIEEYGYEKVRRRVLTLWNYRGGSAKDSLDELKLVDFIYNEYFRKQNEPRVETLENLEGKITPSSD